jgi:type IV pilus assembly protein PilC
MPIYKYKAIKDKKEYEVEREAADKAALYKEIREEGGVVISVEEKKSKEEKKQSFAFLRGIKTEEKIAFAKNLAVMIEAGISMNRGLAIMAKQARNQQLLKVLESLSASIDRGKSLSEGMKEHPDVFSDLFVMMVRSGEESGQVVQALRIVAGQLERSDQLTKKIKGAMIYPAVIVCIMIILGAILLVYMVPTLTETFKGLNIELPLPTRIIIAMSDFLRNYILFVIIFIAGLTFAIAKFFKTTRGKRLSDFLSLHTLVISPLVKQVNSARTARTLSSLVSSGVDIVVAMGVTRDVIQNSYYKEVLEQAGKSIQKGGTISSVLVANTNLYPIFVGEMAAVGEETGQLSAMLENIAVFYEGEVDQKTKDLSTIIEPILMIFIGIAVGIFAVAMLLPTYSLVDAIK